MNYENEDKFHHVSGFVSLSVLEHEILTVKLQIVAATYN